MRLYTGRWGKLAIVCAIFAADTVLLALLVYALATRAWRS